MISVVRKIEHQVHTNLCVHKHIEKFRAALKLEARQRSHAQLVKVYRAQVFPTS